MVYQIDWVYSAGGPAVVFTYHSTLVPQILSGKSDKIFSEM
jgi:hypothetical protein